MSFRLLSVLKVTTFLALIGMTVTLAAIFFYAPLEQVQGIPQKIFYLHLPIAFMSYLGFIITFFGSILFLIQNDYLWDRLALVGAELGVLFCSLILATGMLWGKPIWGAYWTWDPRLTTSLILWLIYVSYLILRYNVEQESQRARYAAVVGVIGFLNVPIVHFAVRLWGRGLHPVVIQSVEEPGMESEMFLTLCISIVSFLFVFISLFLIRYQVESLRYRVNELLMNRDE